MSSNFVRDYTFRLIARRNCLIFGKKMFNVLIIWTRTSNYAEYHSIIKIIWVRRNTRPRYRHLSDILTKWEKNIDLASVSISFCQNIFYVQLNLTNVPPWCLANVTKFLKYIKANPYKYRFNGIREDRSDRDTYPKLRRWYQRNALDIW